MDTVAKDFCKVSNIIHQDEKYGLCVREKMGAVLVEFDVRKASRDQPGFLKQMEGIIAKNLDTDKFSAMILNDTKAGLEAARDIFDSSIDKEIDLLKRSSRGGEDVTARLDTLNRYKSDFSAGKKDYTDAIRRFVKNEAATLAYETVKDMLRDDENEAASPLINTDGMNVGPMRFLSIDPGQFSLTKWMSRHAHEPLLSAALTNGGVKSLLGTIYEIDNPEMAKTFPEGAEEKLDLFVKYHEEGHVTGRDHGLDEPGADYYSFARLLKEQPGAETRDLVTYISDMRALAIMNAPSAKNDKALNYGIGTVLAANYALKLSDDELKKMDDEEMARDASRFDVFAKQRKPVEYAVGRDIQNEILDLMQKSGTDEPDLATMKRAADNLLKKGIYDDPDGMLRGDDNAIKYETLTRFSQALDRLDGRLETMRGLQKKNPEQNPRDASPALPLPQGPAL